MILGKVQAVNDNTGLQIVIDGEEEATTKKYRYLSSYVPKAGDRVLIEEIGDSYVVLGKIIEKYSDSGKATSATSATSATVSQYVANEGETSTNIRIKFRIYYQELYYSSGSGWKKLANG